MHMYTFIICIAKRVTLYYLYTVCVCEHSGFYGLGMKLVKLQVGEGFYRFGNLATLGLG